MTTHILFDFDGTLAESTPAIVESYRYAMTTVLGEDWPVTRPEVEEMLSVRFLEMCDRKAGDRAPELVTTFRERYLGDELQDPPRPFDGIFELFDGLQQRDITVGLVTNKTRIACEHELTRCGLDGLPWACVVTADEAERGKPDPMPVLLGLEATGAAPEAAFYVGDGAHDIEAARGAGVRGIGAAYGDWGAEKLRAAGAHAILDRPLDLLDVVDSERTA